jgi:hypothetical protein
MNIIKRFEKFEIHHKVLLFALLIILTILITRFFVYYIFDPNLKLLGHEIHHFDYGLTILIILSILMLFGEKYTAVYLPLLAISLGFIIDELWFVRKQVGGNNPAIYNPSFVYVIIVAVIVVLVAFLISHFSNKKRK